MCSSTVTSIVPMSSSQIISFISIANYSQFFLITVDVSCWRVNFYFCFHPTLCAIFFVQTAVLENVGIVRIENTGISEYDSCRNNQALSYEQKTNTPVQRLHERPNSTNTHWHLKQEKYWSMSGPPGFNRFLKWWITQIHRRDKLLPNC